MDALDPFGQGYFLPRGFLRESVSSLSRADLIILNHVHEKNHFDSIKREVEKFSKAPLIGTKMEIEGILDLEGKAVEDFIEKKVGIFCAIAHPEYFQQTVKKWGAEIVDHEFMPDHLPFNEKELIQFCARCQAKGAERILCTEKDFVKLDKLAIKHLPIAWMKMRLTIIEGESHWKNFTEKARENLKRRM